ncbi:trafficking protein particle complex subunit 4 [Parasteatoda tepidariorum]|uniref:trafficking protein particle complex subunit 4 n=1 Tax=Parasteatoda tepidariorum TaxID=114398 RepID=UPI00077FE39D|nr:trafficking protein particle complex subunit 4 [Parasteatoda tepidariorum]
MAAISVYIISKAGGMIYQYDHNPITIEYEKTFSFPLDLVLEFVNNRLTVTFGQMDNIKVGHIILSVNGIPLSGRKLTDNRDVMEVLKSEENYPISIKFGRPKLGTNEKIVLASTFHSLFAIASQLSPEPHCSGIEVLEADTFKLYCYQTITGTKFMVVADFKQSGIESLLKKIHELYADYALKNPFYALEMPIRCEQFDVNLQAVLEQVEKTGMSNI